MFNFVAQNMRHNRWCATHAGMWFLELFGWGWGSIQQWYKFKKRKVSEENRTFDATWADSFTFTAGLPVCLICCEKPANKKSNVARHYRIITQPLLKNIRLDLLLVDNLSSAFNLINTRMTQIDMEYFISK